MYLHPTTILYVSGKVYNCTVISNNGVFGIPKAELSISYKNQCGWLILMVDKSCVIHQGLRWKLKRKSHAACLVLISISINFRNTGIFCYFCAPILYLKPIENICFILSVHTFACLKCCFFST